MRQVFAHALRRHDRYRVAEHLSAMTGLKITERMVNDWCSPSRKTLRIPLSIVRAVCEITEDDALALLAMRANLRERAELGAQAIEAAPLLTRMAKQATALAKVKRQKRVKS